MKERRDTELRRWVTDAKSNVWTFSTHEFVVLELQIAHSLGWISLHERWWKDCGILWDISTTDLFDYASVSFGKRVAPGNIVVGGFWHQDVLKFSDPTALTDVAWPCQATWAAQLSFDKDKQLKVAMNGLNMTDEAQGMDRRVVLNLNCRGVDTLWESKMAMGWNMLEFSWFLKIDVCLEHGDLPSWLNGQGV